MAKKVESTAAKKTAKKAAKKKKGPRKFRDKEWNPADQDLGWREFSMIQGMIRDQEQNRLQLRSWGISLVSLFTVAYLAPEIVEIPTAAYCGATLILVGLFFALEIYHAIAEYRLMERSREVEECLRRRKWGYYGPMIGVTLIQRIQFAEFKKIARLRRIHLPYLVMSIGIVLTAVAKLVGVPLPT
jgi:hypothetical protein